jgi:hypothetical protein
MLQLQSTTFLSVLMQTFRQLWTVHPGVPPPLPSSGRTPRTTGSITGNASAGVDSLPGPQLFLVADSVNAGPVDGLFDSEPSPPSSPLPDDVVAGDPGLLPPAWAFGDNTLESDGFCTPHPIAHGLQMFITVDVNHLCKGV